VGCSSVIVHSRFVFQAKAGVFIPGFKKLAEFVKIWWWPIFLKTALFT
jgi:hypothetical protein